MEEDSAHSLVLRKGGEITDFRLDAALTNGLATTCPRTEPAGDVRILLSGVRCAPPRAPDVRQYAPMPFVPGTDARAVEPARIRLAAAAAAVVTVGAGLGLRAVAAGSPDKYGGVALYTVLILTLVVLVAPRVTPLTAAGSALAVSWGVEFLQLSEVTGELAQRSAVIRLVLGSTFNPPDLFWYAVGAAAGGLVHTAVGSTAAHAAESARTAVCRPDGQRACADTAAFMRGALRTAERASSSRADGDPPSTTACAACRQ